MTATTKPVLSGFCNPSWSLNTRQGRESHAKCLKADCPCTCGLGMVHGGNATPVEGTCPCLPGAPEHEHAQGGYADELGGIAVVYTRNGDESFEAGWHCREDADRFADWLRDCGAAIDVEVVEL